MPCSDSLYNPLTMEKETNYVPYSTTPQYQVQPAMPGITAAQALPAGAPSIQPYAGVPLIAAAPVTYPAVQTPQTVQNPYYTAGYLRRYIGRDMRVEFLIGTNGPLVDRIGTLLEVGASYIVLRPIRSNDTLVCDIYSIKFVTIYG